MEKRMAKRGFQQDWQHWLGGTLMLGALLLGGSAPAAANNGDLNVVYGLLNELDRAICFNQWDQALALTDALIATDSITDAYRLELMTFRQELMSHQTNRAIIPDNTSCARVYPSILAVPASSPVTTVANAAPAIATTSNTTSSNTTTSNATSADVASSASASPTSGGLNWNEGIASVTGRRAPVVQLDTRPEAEINPVIPLALFDGSNPALLPSSPIETFEGFNVVAGQVGEYHQAYSFVARLGDRLSLDLDVTRVFPGTLYTNDDSQIYLFNAQGQLLAFNDDADGRQSNLSNFLVPQTDLYFVVVTSHNNTPIWSSNQTLSGWSETGGAKFDYTLTLTGVTPSVAIFPE
jgi:hypothetical protein